MKNNQHLADMIASMERRVTVMKAVEKLAFDTGMDQQTLITELLAVMCDVDGGVSVGRQSEQELGYLTTKHNSTEVKYRHRYRGMMASIYRRLYEAERNGAAVSMQEIKGAFGLAGRDSVEHTIRRLADMKHIQETGHNTSAYRLTPEGMVEAQWFMDNPMAKNHCNRDKPGAYNPVTVKAQD